ncbi:prolyl oligopeptidase family protein [Streptomyces sp. NPDC057654]|uniref:prolyl oligopeptidase family serine peptidase n=1 Tax=Streptomyces sp. NPDC057654 TaxID=3346196 RepID=UPI0036C8B7B2
MGADDQYLWLEDLHGAEALPWAKERTQETEQLLCTDEFTQTAAELRGILDDPRRIPYVHRRGDSLYGFWRDAQRVRGTWRRTTLAEYRREDPGWETLLDLDALAAAEGEDWSWAGAKVLYPGYDRALVTLSRSGSDAVVVREFDLETKAFVPGGFQVPEGKTRASWIDQDTLYIGADLGPGSLTASGYPRTVRQWRRGTPLAQAPVVFEGTESDLSTVGWFDATPGFERHFVSVHRDFWHRHVFLLDEDGQEVKLDVPDDSRAYAHRQWLIVIPKSEWEGHPAGSLLAFGFDAFLQGVREPAVLFAPDARTALAGHAWTRHHLLLKTRTDGNTGIEVLTPPADSTPGAWTRRPLTDVPPLASATITAVDRDSDEYFLTIDGFLHPPALHRGEIGTRITSEVLKQTPAHFDTSGLRVRQHFATSPDGTQVPYYLVGPDTGRPSPTLLYGYGGFGRTLAPDYLPLTGKGWMARGGTYAVACIRGGGEYGPAWHQAALKAHRPKAFEDFAAVAQDLIARGITTPAQLGIMGRSNGGLLMGAMLARHPHLFGAVIISAPILDLLRFHLLHAGASWTAEYGDPDDPADRPHLEAISPYHHFRADQPYPPVLLVTSTSDDRVHPAHARKAAALLRAQGHQVLFHETTAGGHQGAADHAQAAQAHALKYAFLWQTLHPQVNSTDPATVAHTERTADLPR